MRVKVAPCRDNLFMGIGKQPDSIFVFPVFCLRHVLACMNARLYGPSFFHQGQLIG